MRQRPYWSDFKPNQVQSSPQLYGAAIGDEHRIVAWFRDVQCIGPDWPTRRLAGQRVTLIVSGQINKRQVAAYDPVTLRILEKGEVNCEGSSVHIELPEFEEAIVLQLAHDETRK